MKITCFSDTHGFHRKMEIFDELSGDILVFCGDYQTNSKDKGFDFLDWISKLNFKKKVVSFGNHDSNYKEFTKEANNYKDVFVLNNSGLKVMGIKFFGIPYTGQNGCEDFKKTEKELEYYFKNIPNSTQILVTHSPPLDILDKSYYFPHRVGNETLLKKVFSLKNLKYHLFGHIHEGYGRLKKGKIQFFNSAILDKDFKTLNDPFTFEF